MINLKTHHLPLSPPLVYFQVRGGYYAVTECEALLLGALSMFGDNEDEDDSLFEGSAGTGSQLRLQPTQGTVARRVLPSTVIPGTQGAVAVLEVSWKLSFSLPTSRPVLAQLSPAPLPAAYQPSFPTAPPVPNLCPTLDQSLPIPIE